MTSRDFAYWLQGFFEITGATAFEGDTEPAMNAAQVAMVKKHLALVFVHEIDPSMGSKDEQDKLNKIHNKPFPNGPIHGGDPLARC